MWICNIIIYRNKHILILILILMHSKNRGKGKYTLNTGKVNKRHWYSAILTWIVI